MVGPKACIKIFFTKYCSDFFISVYQNIIFFPILLLNLRYVGKDMLKSSVLSDVLSD